MEKINTILDRKPINSEYINSKQDFNKVMNGFQKLKPPVYKQSWFYGALGLAAVAIVFTAVSLTLSDDDKKTVASADVKKEVPFEQEPPQEKIALVVDMDETAEEIPEVEPVIHKPPIETPVPIAEEPAPVQRRAPVEAPVVVEIPKITKPHIAGVFNGAI